MNVAEVLVDPSSSPSSPPPSVDELSIDFSDPFGWILALQCVISLSLNLTVLTAFFKEPSLRLDGSTALLLNLVLADLGITLCGCPFSATAAFYGRWPFGEIGCTLYGFQGMLFGLASIMSVAALQLDRYLLICRDVDSASSGHRIISTAVVWINAGFWSSVPVFGWHRYGVEASGVSCAIDYQDSSISYVTWLAGVFTASYVGPLLAMLFFESRIRREPSHVSPARTSDPDRVCSTKGFGTSRTFFGLLTVFFVCWTPYALLCIYAVFFPVSSLPLALTKLPAISAKSATILNPVVYLTVDRVRDAVRGKRTGGSNKKEN